MIFSAIESNGCDVCLSKRLSKRRHNAMLINFHDYFYLDLSTFGSHYSVGVSNPHTGLLLDLLCCKIGDTSMGWTTPYYW